MQKFVIKYAIPAAKCSQKSTEQTKARLFTIKYYEKPKEKLRFRYFLQVKDEKITVNFNPPRPKTQSYFTSSRKIFRPRNSNTQNG